MNRFTSLLRKELTEFARTWKIWVIPGLFIVLAVTGVLSARFAKELMQSLLPAGSDMSTLIPDPTWRDTLGQWTKNLSQIGTIAILLMSGGIINTEGRQGTQILILTKPVSRWDYVLAKFVSTVIFCTATVTVGALVEYAASLIFFHDSRALPLLQLTATWLLYALVLVAVPLIGSAASPASWLRLALASRPCLPSACSASGDRQRSTLPLGWRASRARSRRANLSHTGGPSGPGLPPSLPSSR
ncbi:ABC transporter permease [Cutibacterium acnes]